MSENIQKSPLPCGGGLGVGETQSIKQGYKQTSLGILPQEWEVVRLGEVGDIVGGGTPDTTNSAFWNGEILWLTPTEIKQKYIFDSERKITQKGLLNSSAKLLPKNTILITTRATIGDIGIATQELSTNQGFQSFISGEKVNFEFMYYLLGAKKREFIALANGSTFLEISAKTIRQIQIPLPPLAEQEKIAQILSVWDKGISVLKSLIEAKTKRKKALMQRLLTPPTHPLTPSAREGEQKSHHDTKAPPLAGGVGVGYSHIENNRNDDKVLDCHDLTASNLAMTEKNSKAKQSLRFAEFTDKWQEMRLGDICEIYQPQTIPQSDFTKEGYNVYGANGIIGKYHSYNHEKEQIAIACRGNSCGAVNFTNPKSWITGNAMVINLDNSKNADKIFVYYMLLNSNLNYLVTGSGQPQITSNIKNHSIKLPTLAEQKKIAQVLSACDKEIELLKSKFQCLKTQKKGLMQRLLNGEVRVKC